MRRCLFNQDSADSANHEQTPTGVAAATRLNFKCRARNKT
ncbi:hypothetical protein MPQ_2343 [Methylovorus sp. MP688]|nr:hypothetical protein MPQ_2343 [Methylovorus sp. MP688]